MRYTAKELRKTALYVAWRDMIRRARREWAWRLRLGAEEPFMVSKEFTDFDKFALWARTAGGYRLGEDSAKIVARKDPRKPFDPSNAVFTSEYMESFGFTPPNPAGKACGRAASRRSLHGLSGTRLYEIWKGMRRRCSDPKQKDYPDYGARGIRVCDAWNDSFDEFMDWAWNHGYSVDLTLDRIDVDGNYCPENCRWATFLEQKLNTRIEAKTYINLRMKAGRMARFMASLAPDCVVTAICRRDAIGSGALPEQDDFAAVPIDERIDMMRSYKRRRGED